MAKSYRDADKQLARGRLESFIARNLRYKSPKDITVLCFPGAEQDDEVGLEIREVYDSLRIPRENITGLEYAVQPWRRLQKANLGIELTEKPMRDIEFFQQVAGTGRKWDVISLDYSGYFDEDKLYSLELIVGEGLLKDRGILCTNFMAGRENEAAQGLIRENYKTLSLNEKLLKLQGGGYIAKSIGGGWVPSSDVLSFLTGERIPKPVDADIRDSRADTIRFCIYGTLRQGRAALNLKYLSPFNSPEMEGIVKQLVNAVKGVADGGSVRLLIYDDEDEQRIKSQNLCDGVLEALESKHGRSAEEKLSRHGGIRWSVNTILLNELRRMGFDDVAILVLTSIGQRPYLVESAESYTYVSNSGQRMLFDLVYADRHARKFEVLDSLINSPPRRIRKREFKKRIKGAQGLAMDLAKKMLLTPKDFPPRRELKASSRALGERAVKKDYGGNENWDPEDREAVILWLEEGYSSREISEIIGGKYSVMQVAGLKAWLTRQGNGDSRLVDLREAVLERDSYSCLLCGTTEERNRQNSNHGLHVHHIDYNHDNDDLGNLASLCTGCHAKSNTVQHAEKIRKDLESKIRAVVG